MMQLHFSPKHKISWYYYGCYLKWQNHIIHRAGKIRLLFYKFKTLSNILLPTYHENGYHSYGPSLYTHVE